MIRDEQHRSSEEPVSPRCIKYNTKGSREKADFAEALEENEAERTNAVASDMEALDNIARAQLSAEDPDVTLSARERRAGGLGVFMVKNMMDTVTYDYRDEENILTICKVLGS